MPTYNVQGSSLTSVADAIRTSCGISSQLSFPNGFVNAIGNFVNVFDYCTQVRFANKYPSTTPNIHLKEATTLAEMFYYDNSSYPYTSITITVDKQITSVNRTFGNYKTGSYGLKSVTLNGDLSKVTTYTDYVKAQLDLEEIKGTPLDFTSVTTDSNSKWCGPNGDFTKLTYVRYKPNTLKVNHSIFNCPALSNDSIVSIANGLQVIAKTLTLHATVSGKLSTIYGTVDNDGIFTETNDSNDTTLLSFITTTKGWTVA